VGRTCPLSSTMRMSHSTCGRPCFSFSSVRWSAPRCCSAAFVPPTVPTGDVSVMPLRGRPCVRACVCECVCARVCMYLQGVSIGCADDRGDAGLYSGGGRGQKFRALLIQVHSEETRRGLLQQARVRPLHHPRSRCRHQQETLTTSAGPRSHACRGGSESMQVHGFWGRGAGG